MKEVDVNGVRYRLMQYTSLIKDIDRWKLKIIELETKIDSVASGSPKKLPEEQRKDVDWRSPLFDDIAKYEALIKTNEALIKLVHDFVYHLPEERDKNIINDLYLNNLSLTQVEVADKYGYSRRGLQKRISVLIKQYWKY